MFKNKQQALSWTAVLLWMILIFTLSAQPAPQSSALSRRGTEIIINVVSRIMPLSIESSTDSIADIVSSLNYTVRKTAHFFAYFILAILVMNALRRSGVLGLRGIILTFLICVLYAISDEVHQLFIPGRSGQITDVMIDSAGAAVGILGYHIKVSTKKYRADQPKTIKRD